MRANQKAGAHVVSAAHTPAPHRRAACCTAQRSAAHLAHKPLVLALHQAGEEVKVEGAGAVGAALPHKRCRKGRGGRGKSIDQSEWSIRVP